MKPLDVLILAIFFGFFLAFLRLEYLGYIKKRNAIRKAKADTDSVIESYAKRQANAPDMQAYQKAHQKLKQQELDASTESQSSNSN